MQAGNSTDPHARTFATSITAPGTTRAFTAACAARATAGAPKIITRSPSGETRMDAPLASSIARTVSPRGPMSRPIAAVRDACTPVANSSDQSYAEI
jgi:hypothetical protein